MLSGRGGASPTLVFAMGNGQIDASGTCPTRFSKRADKRPPVPTMVARFASILAAYSILVASPSVPGASATAEERSLTIAAAANMSDALEEIKSAYAAKHAVKLVYSFGASGSLAQQIRHGAPFDLLLSADVRTVAKLLEEGWILPGTAKIYARGQLVLWTEESTHVRLNTLEDVLQPAIERIAIAHPATAPYGRAAVEALEAAGLWDRVKDKIIYAENVNQAQQYAATRNTDVAFIPLALVRRAPGRFVRVDGKLHVPIDQALGVVRNSVHHAEAKEFAEFLLSEQGRVILKKFGYTLP